MSAQPPQGYGPPQNNGTNWLPIVIIGVIALGILAIGAIFVVLFAAGVAAGVANRKASPPTKVKVAHVANSVPLTQSYSPKNGLFTVRYPADFAASSLDGSTISLERNLSGGDSEVVLVAAVANPISDDVNEFGRVLLLGTQRHVEGDGGTYREIRRENVTCTAGLPGFRVDAEATLAGGGQLQLQTCFAMHSGHGYEFKTIAPKRSAAAELPLLNRILDSTTLSD